MFMRKKIYNENAGLNLYNLVFFYVPYVMAHDF